MTEQSPVEILLGTQPTPEPEQAEVPDSVEAEEPSDTPDQGEPEPVEEPEPPEPERVEGDFSEMYDKVVPGTDLTLGELKDAAKDYGKVTELREQNESQRSELERDRLKLNQQIQELTTILPPGALNEQTIAELQARVEAKKQHAAEMLVSAIPAWREPEAKAADVKLIQDNLADYGIAPEMVTSVVETDPVLTKVLLDKARSDKLGQDVIAERKRTKRKHSQARGTKAPSDPAAKIKAARADGSLSQDDAVTALLLGRQIK